MANGAAKPQKIGDGEWWIGAGEGERGHSCPSGHSLAAGVGWNMGKEVIRQ
jgi:hypothetical protein